MSDQVSAPASQDAGAEIVWAESPATGRKKEMTRNKLRVLAPSGWTECAAPDSGDSLVVRPFPSASSEEAGQQQPEQVVVETPPVGVDNVESGQNDQQRSRTGRRPAAEQEGS